MKIIDKPLLALFRRPGRCEWCGKFGPRDPHHLFARGMGGGGRLDIRINLVSICRDCHNACHDGQEPGLIDLLAIVAQRENTTQDAIRREIWRLRRADKSTRDRGRKAKAGNHCGNEEGASLDLLHPYLPASLPRGRSSLETDTGG